MKKSFLLFGTIVILLLAGCSKEPDPQATKEYESALETVNRFPIEAADSAFEDLTNRADSADWREYREALGQELHLQYLDAADNYWKILDRNDEFAPAYLGLSRIMMQLDYPYLSLDMARQYAKISPSRKGGYYELARVLLTVGDLKDARDVIDKARKAGLDTAVADWMDARALYLDLKLDDASEMVTRAMAAQQRTPRFYREAADFYEAAGKYDSAHVMSQAAVNASDNDLRSLEQRLFLCLRTNYFYDARLVLQAIDSKDTSKVLQTSVKFKYDLAIQNYPAAYMEFSDYRKASGETLNSLMWEFDIRRVLGDHFTANQVMTTMDMNKERVGHSPRFREFLEYMQVRMNLETRRYPEAVMALDSLEDNWRKGDGYKLDLAAVHFATGGTKAAETLDDLRNKYDDNPSWLMRMGDALGQPTLFKADDAVKYYEYALEASSDYLPAFQHMIDLLLREKQYTNALKDFNSYPQFPAASPLLAVRQAFCTAHAGDADAAVELFERNAPEISGDLFVIDDFFRGLDFSYSREQLLAALDRLVSLDKDNPDILAMAAQWYSDYGEYKKAESAADDALEIEPDLLKASVQKARAVYLKGDKKKGLDMFASLMKTNPYDTELNMYYAHALATEKKDMRMAGNYARLAIASIRNNKRAETNLWYVYGQDGRWDLATGEARQLSNAYPDDPRGFFMLGKALYLNKKADKKTEAKESLQKALDLGLQGPDKTEAEEMLTKL